MARLLWIGDGLKNAFCDLHENTSGVGAAQSVHRDHAPQRGQQAPVGVALLAVSLGVRGRLPGKLLRAMSISALSTKRSSLIFADEGRDPVGADDHDDGALWSGVLAGPLDEEERRRLEMVEGIVLNIQRYSLHDGPGLRTNVFLKGCPLSCVWCANPESQRLQPELAFYAHNCIPCGLFRDHCPAGWRAVESWTKEQAAEYAARADVCPTGALHWMGERRTAGSVISEVLRDRPFYEDGGGMTLTGGEATMQPEMALALLRLAKNELVHTSLETAGYTRWPVLGALARHLDVVLFDLKHVDSGTHRHYTGVGNELILENLRRLVAAGANVLVRIPLIPGFNADRETVEAMAELIANLEPAARGRSIQGIDVLPYHTLGRAKYAALGRDYGWAEHSRLTEAEVTGFAAILEQTGYRVGVGG